MISQLPVLQVVVPLLAAPLCLLLRRRVLCHGFSIAVGWSTFAVALLLLREVLHVGVVSYSLGGWAAPWGIQYRVDALGAFVLTFVSGIGALVLTFAPASVGREIPRDRIHMFLGLFLLSLAGLLGIAITGDMFNVFVFLEISALSGYALISLGRDRRALTASFQYLVLGTIGATFILIGIGLMYIMTGTLNMLDMAERLRAVAHTRTILAAFGFLTVGTALKMGLFPLHLWLPNAYTYAPSTVSAFLAATATKVAVYFMLRFVFTVYGSELAFQQLGLAYVLMPLALIAALVGSVVAVFQEDVKRLLAYSSVAQIGYMVLGLSFASVTGLTAAIVHLFNHALMKCALFLAMGCISFRVGSVRLHALRGLGRQMPWTMFAWVLGGLGLIGVPLTAGFISKLYLIRAALDAGFWPVASVVLLTSLVALVYVWRVIEVAYFQPAPADRPAVREAPLSMLIPVWILILAVIAFGASGSFSAGLAHRAAVALLGVDG